MKKLLTLLLLLCVIPMAFISCKKNDDTAPTPFKVNFVVDGQIVKTVETTGKDTVKLPADPEKEGYTFVGWFWDSEQFTADTFVKRPFTSSSDINVYAKFTKNNGGVVDGFPTGGDTYYDEEGWTEPNK